MKKSIFLLLLPALLISSCGSKKPEENVLPVEPEGPSEPEEVKEIALPRFTIDTEGGAPITSKEEYVPGSLTITNSDGFDDSNLSLGIRGRGNYSWSGTEKKSYRIKFDEKYQPLGTGKGKCKSWTLLAVHCDKSLLRTHAAFRFASQLENLPFTSSSTFVELYLNGSYDGVYELCDQIQVNKYRVDIDDTGDEEDIGYLVELDKNASENVISSSRGETFEVKSDYANSNQLYFIQNYIRSCENAIYNGNQSTIASLIDIPSMVDAYLVEEVFKNLDVGWGSFYYTKPKGDKLKFGPVWDFDLSAGNAKSDSGESSFYSYKYTYVGSSHFKNYMQQHTWYLQLRKQAWFNSLVKERYFEVEPLIENTIENIKYMAKRYHSGFENNFTRWDIFNQKINREPAVIMNIKTFDGQVDYLCEWLTNRMSWLDGYYKGDNADLS